MWKDRLRRYVRAFKNMLKGAFVFLLPAVIVVILVGGLMFAVATSKDGSFRPCFDELVSCMGDDLGAPTGPAKLWKMTKCSYRTAWCDINILWGKAAGRAPEPALPAAAEASSVSEEEYLEKQAEIMKYLTSEEVLNERSEQVRREMQEESGRPEQMSPQELKEEMKRLAAERKAFEAEQAEFRRLLGEAVKARGDAGADSDILSGQKEK